jgi:thioredoxin reductase (NADPH)
MDRPHIFISDLRLPARVGVNPGEDETNQTIVLDIWVGAEDFDRAAASCRLGDTVDYVGIARAARKVVGARHYPLVETLATRVAEAVLERPGASWVRVRLQKLECLRHASAAGVEVELRAGRLPADQVAHPRPVPLADVQKPEIVIVGGGAAGLAAALWCHRLGHEALVIDAAEHLGGQLHLVHGQMSDLPGIEPLSGARLASRLWRQFAEHGGRWCQVRLEQLIPANSSCRLALSSKERGERELDTKAVILCTGVRRRQLGVPGERELLGRGVLHTAARDTALLRGKHVAVVGGGDSACENALILTAQGARVTLVHRGRDLTAQEQFRRRIEAHADIDVQLDTRVLAFHGRERLEAVELSGPGGSTALAAEAALVRVGWLPNSEGLPQAWLDPQGFVCADLDCRIRGERRVFTAGDLLGRLAPSVATAFGSGATAARAAVLLLEQ